MKNDLEDFKGENLGVEMKDQAKEIGWMSNEQRKEKKRRVSESMMWWQKELQQHILHHDHLASQPSHGFIIGRLRADRCWADVRWDYARVVVSQRLGEVIR